MKLTKEQKEYIAYQLGISDFLKDKYAMLLSTFLEDNHDRFMEHIENKYEDENDKINR